MMHFKLYFNLLILFYYFSLKFTFVNLPNFINFDLIFAIIQHLIIQQLLYLAAKFY